MLFATVGALLVGRMSIRLFYYAFDQCTATTFHVDKETGKVVATPVRKAKQAKLVLFFRPFRKLLRTAALASTAVCLLHAHCWSRDLGAFKVDVEDGAGAVCRAVFSPMAFGGMVASSTHDRGVDESSIWFLWAVMVVVLLTFFLQDELAGKHVRTSISGRPRVNGTSLASNNQLGTASANQAVATEYESSTEDGSSASSSLGSQDLDEIPAFDDVVERPKDTLPMVSWYSILMFHTVFDMLIEFKVFLGTV